MTLSALFLDYSSIYHVLDGESFSVTIIFFKLSLSLLQTNIRD